MASTITGADITDLTYTSVLAGHSSNLTLTQVTVATNDVLTFHDATAGDAITLPAAITGCVQDAPAAGDVQCTTPNGGFTNVDLLLGDSNDQVTLAGTTPSVREFGGAGADTLRGSDVAGASVTLDGGADGDTLQGNVSDDIVDYQLRTQHVNATVDSGVSDDGETGEGDNITGAIDVILGGSGNDTIDGGPGDNRLLDGLDGNDTINGGGGNDTVNGGTGADDLHGGAGSDQVTESRSVAADSISITQDDAANDGIMSPAEGDNVHSDIENVFTDVGTGNDTITGGPGANVLSTNNASGNDIIDAVDGVSDIVLCGDGVDGVFADTSDDLNFNQTTTCEAAVNARSLTFADRETGTTSTSQTVTVRNPGGSALALGAVTATGDFAKGADTCSNASIAVGQTCTISVTFSPTTTGVRSGTLTITNSAAGAVPMAVALSGTGTTPAVTPIVTPVIPNPITTNPIVPSSGTPNPGTTNTGTGVAKTLPAPKSLSVTVSPSRDRSKPYRFTIKGKLGLAAGVTKTKGCSGTVTVTVKRGTKIVATKKVSLTKDCTYSAKVTISGKGKLKISAKFAGNSVMSAKSSPVRSARAG